MRADALLLAAVLVASQPASGQAPAVPAEQLVTFDPDQTELRWTNTSWQLVAGSTLVRDFGRNQVAGWEALRLIRSLHLTQHGTLGSPRPILEYWLSNGQAPQGLGGGHLVPIDLSSLRVEAIQGQWCVCDAQRLLFNFGRQQAEAAQAVDLIRRYGFTQVGYLGWPAPYLMYFLGGSGTFPPPAPPSRFGPSLAPNRAAVLQAQLLTAGSHQLAPPQTGPANAISFNPWRVEVQSSDRQWLLRAGEHVLARFGSMMEAQQAAAVVRSYGFTEQVYLGTPGQSFSYFLVRGQPPRGLRPRVFAQVFRPESVVVRQLGNDWMVFAEDQLLQNFGSRADEARQLVQTIQRYGFDHLGRIGPEGPLSMTFLVKLH
jgi:hypothetical protein